MKNLINNVNAINLLHKEANKIIHLYIDHFNKFEGQKICNVGGEIGKKFAIRLPGIDGNFEGAKYNIHSWIETTNHSLIIRVKICLNGGSYDIQPSTAFCIYREINFYAFEISHSWDNTELNGVLKINPNYLFKPFKTNFKAIELQKIATKVKKAAENYNKIADSMPYQFKDLFYIERLTR